MAVCKSLFGNTGPGHRDAYWYRIVFSNSVFNDYWKFAVVRNPYDRLVSAFFFLKNGGVSEQDRRWAERHLSSYIDFSSFVKGWLTKASAMSQMHFVPQHCFVCDRRGRLLLDYTARYERLAEDFREIAEHLSVNTELVMVNTSGEKRDYRSFYDEEAAGIAGEVYKKDLDLFNYAFEGAEDVKA